MSEPKNRSLAIALALAAAAALVYAGLTRQWLVNGNKYEQYGFGLRSTYACGQSFGEAHECDEMSNSEYVAHEREVSSVSARNTSSAFAPMGWATLVECLLAAAGLVAAAGIALARKRPDLPMAPTTVTLLALMAALITGCVFVATKPGAPGFVGVGISFWIFGAGAVAGIAGAQMLAKVNRPVDPDLMEDAMNPEHF
ncbi:MAG: hypothetical protein ACM31C_15355 [Acidobacteriota bacterium]